MTAQRTATVIATITPRLQLVSAEKGGARSGSRSGDSHAEAIVGHAYRPTRMLVPSDTDASVVRYESTFRPIRTDDDGQEHANNGQNACRRWLGRLTKTIRRMLEMIIILAEMVTILAEMVINLSEMVKRVAGRSWGIIGMVVGMATVKDRTRRAAGSIGYIAGAVVVATAVYTLLIYIGGSVCLVSRRINTMPGRGCMVDGRVCMVGRRGNVEGRRVNMVGRRINIMLARGSMVVANAKAVVGRVGPVVGRVRTKAIKKGSTEVLPLDVLLI